VDQHRDLPLAQPEVSRSLLVEDSLYALKLEEVVSRAERAELAYASLPRPRGHRARIRALEPPS
jgi:hypothetical protein